MSEAASARMRENRNGDVNCTCTISRYSSSADTVGCFESGTTIVGLGSVTPPHSDLAALDGERCPQRQAAHEALFNRLRETCSSGAKFSCASLAIS